jgi:hypothetical protein
VANCKLFLEIAAFRNITELGHTHASDKPNRLAQKAASSNTAGAAEQMAAMDSKTRRTPCSKRVILAMRRLNFLSQEFAH